MRGTDRLKRRHFLAASVAVGVSSIATAPAWLSSTQPSPPTFDTQSVGEKWEQLSSEESVAFENSYGPLTVTATQQTVMLENVQLRTELRERTLGNFDAQISIAFATRVDIDPKADDLPANIGREEVMTRITEQGQRGFKRQLLENDINDIQTVGKTVLETGQSGPVAATKYEGTYAFDAIKFTVTDEASITIPGDELTVNGLLATWHDGTSPIIAGGVYPGENFVETVQESLTDAIDVRLDIDLGLTPSEYRENLVSLVGSVD